MIMNKNYFSVDEDFESIIKDALKNKKIVSINKISTGWTNIVYEVSTDSGSYFFRFPRDEFWSRTIKKDYEFSKFISGKTDFKTVQLELCYDKGRPFSMHKKIEGVPLAEKMEKLSEKEIQTISEEIAQFMYQTHQIEGDFDSIFKTKEIGLKLVDFLDELLNIHIDKKNRAFWHYDDFIKKDHKCLVHGDLNSSNILLDEKNHIAAVIDFGFAGFGNPYFDIARIIGRCPKSYQQPMIESYEKISHQTLNSQVLNQEIDVWGQIDHAYIDYMTEIGIYKPNEKDE